MRKVLVELLSVSFLSVCCILFMVASSAKAESGEFELSEFCYKDSTFDSLVQALDDYFVKIERLRHLDEKASSDRQHFYDYGDRIWDALDGTGHGLQQALSLEAKFSRSFGRYQQSVKDLIRLHNKAVRSAMYFEEEYYALQGTEVRPGKQRRAWQECINDILALNQKSRNWHTEYSEVINQHAQWEEGMFGHMKRVQQKMALYSDAGR